VRSIVGLARDLGIETVAEGVQCEEELTILAEVGCTSAQGYLISKPVPAGAIARLAGPAAAPLPPRPAAAE
jgi:EAL domain-containing protein (putative c-di-GMP-specific phosphodiesterase class I)